MKKIKRICILDSTHTLLQYLLLSKEEEVLSTYFFWGNGIPKSIKSFFFGRYSNINRIYKSRIFYFFLYYLYVPIRWPFLLFGKYDYWCVDHLPYSSSIIRNNHYTLLEDGLLNYTIRPQYKRLIHLQRIFFGKLAIPHLYSGQDQLCDKIYLTGLKDVPLPIKDKVQICKLKELWNLSDAKKQEFIKRMFDISESLVEQLKDKKAILLTQPLSEDGIITEVDKIKIYSEIVKQLNKNQLVIKTHPRERTNYHVYFKELLIIDHPVPIQLLSLMDVKFKDVYTLYTSAAYDFPYHVNVAFIGSQVHPVLKARVPSMTKESFSSYPDNVTPLAFSLPNIF